MLYSILKLPAILALKIYGRNIQINKPEHVKATGPLLIAANHPNSFLDAIIIATIFKRPVYSLVRGDVYSNPFYAKLLSSLNMMPVYRMSEGAENLGQNYSTFEKCRTLFQKNAIVLIFSEGRCINEWKLRPLMKGTARLALSTWEAGIPLQILPTGINYQSFVSFGKNIEINFGKLLGKEVIANTNGYGQSLQAFNSRLQMELQPCVVSFQDTDKQNIKKHFEIPVPLAKKIFLYPFALLGAIVHAPLFLPIKWFCEKKALQHDHYDSVMVGLLFVLYPIYILLMLFVVGTVFGGYWWTSIPFLLPFMAYSYVQVKNQFK